MSLSVSLLLFSVTGTATAATSYCFSGDTFGEGVGRLVPRTRSLSFLSVARAVKSDAFRFNWICFGVGYSVTEAAGIGVSIDGYAFLYFTGVLSGNRALEVSGMISS